MKIKTGKFLRHIEMFPFCHIPLPRVLGFYGSIAEIRENCGSSLALCAGRVILPKLIRVDLYLLNTILLKSVFVRTLRLI
jgi:hypothetical protein